MTEDTRAVLLLCAALPDEGPKPLTPTEYERVVRFLQAQGMRPRDLLQSGPVLPPDLPRERLLGLLQREVDLGRWSRLGIWVLSRADEAYPRRLKAQLARRSPPLLFGLGEAALLNRPAVAIVGSREASPEALAFAEDLARQAGEAGLAVVSGGARGVDTAAMNAAPEAVGFLAGGLLQASRRSGRCLVSACSPHVTFSTGLAMARNRYIYSQARVAFVADSGLRGGTWEGAVEALKHDRVGVFVRSGEALGEGNAALVQRGARWFAPSDGLQAALCGSVPGRVR